MIIIFPVNNFLFWGVANFLNFNSRFFIIKTFNSDDLGYLFRIFLSISSVFFKFSFKKKPGKKKRILIFLFEFLPNFSNSPKQKFNILSLSLKVRVSLLYFDRPNLVKKKLYNFP